MPCDDFPAPNELAAQAAAVLSRLGLRLGQPGRGEVISGSPIDGTQLAVLPAATAAETEAVVTLAAETFRYWRTVPAPRRGDVVRRLGQLLGEHKSDLAALVTLEAGKIESEALGEVQEMIDICDFAVGLSRQLYGKTMPSERPLHRLSETWHPLGVVAVISAFNFPVAVWAWNTAVALVAGDTVVWKPSEITPLTAAACTALLDRAIQDTGAPAGIHQLVQGGREVGGVLVDDPRVALVSATGSVRMGREIGPKVAARFGRSLLELGGNNAVIVTASADLDLAVRGIVFAAAGTAGQRCTSLRRLIAHRSVADEITARIADAYRRLPIGSPLQPTTLVGPLIHEGAFRAFEDALAKAQADGGTIVAGGHRVLTDRAPHAYYVEPTIVTMPHQGSVVHDETFAPILYALTYDEFEAAIELNNAVPQGLSSAIFTTDQREAELFVSASGSDCGIANVNIGTSGAEIGGAFGGEKETGGGRESGSDSWKAYMRRATNTVNYSTDLPLAQGVVFS
ncbi:aldehyde dehydrogenase [Mycobacterium sp. 852013-50091_SCH5140682]|uniref:L-piperidine-6-carboxylate dehydrogenase n=1 Tax=Mycobacterium sp. 852013-50091_SCH5140682 TaxID=1834109 RepID=UPI0007EAB626|nr:aldehyde dehydrogenase family protein [Mycobacterium sp. 852013-50091_SCH5140682]OBC01792.1 aldehyde dehydrogenase [Mycobacterium sp. 852013-50091_SCH5140682]